MEKAGMAQWGYLNFARGRILCIRVSGDKVILVEPDGGYFYPMPGEIEPAEVPDERTLLLAITSAAFEDLEALHDFCAQPRTMQEIEDKFPDVEAWRLRKLGILRDSGRRNRRIVLQWVGWSLPQLLSYVFSLEGVPSRNDNSPSQQK
jgi:hypothetical protein